MDGNLEIHTTDADKAPKKTFAHAEHGRSIALDKLEPKLPPEILRTLLVYSAIT